MMMSSRQSQKALYAKQQGASAILMIGLFFVSIAIGAFSVDMAYYYAQQNKMRITADSAASAAISELYKNAASSYSTRAAAARTVAKSYVSTNSDWEVEDTSIEIGYIDPATRQYNASTFATPSATSYTTTGGYNAVRVTITAAAGADNDSVTPLFSRFFGRQSMDTQAVSTAMYSTGISSVTGARPFFMCDAAWDAVSAMGGDPAAITVRMYYDRIEVINGGVTTTLTGASACNGEGLNFPSYGGGSVSASAMQDQIEDGFSSWVNMGSSISFDTGNHLTSAMTGSFDAIIGQEIIATTYSSATTSAATATGVVSFVLDGYDVTGAIADRYLEGHFLGTVACGNNCQIGGTTTGNDSVAKFVFVH